MLATLRAAATLDLTDPFFIVDLPVDVDDDALVRARISALVAFWNKERSPNYKQLALELARHRSELEAVLLNPAARARAAQTVRVTRAAADANRYGELDGLATQLATRFGGVPRSRVTQLAQLATSKGLSDAAFADWLARHRVLEDTADAEPLSRDVRAQIRSSLDELGRLTGDAARTATLWALLELPPTATPEEVGARHAELQAANQRRQHDRQQTVTADLLTYARQHLAGADRARYAASLVEDAKTRLKDTVTEKVIVEGELSAADFEACVRKAMGFGYGLSSEQARTAVRQLVTNLGASLQTGKPIDYVVCASCREPQPAGARTCRYCGSDLYTDCPACRQPVEAAAVACPHCGASLRAIRAAGEQVEAARAALGQGHPAAAKSLLAGVRTAVPAVPRLAAEVATLDQEVDRVLTAAAADWRAADQDTAAHRLYSAVDRVARLARVASDVPGANGVSATSRRTELAARKATVQAEVAAARRLPTAEREVALGRVLAVAADCAEALDLLSSIPLAPPRDLRVQVLADAVRLRWSPAPAAGAVSYKVTRVVTAPDGSPGESRVVGTTSACELDDAGVPGGALVAHELVAVAGRRASTPVRTTSTLMLRDVAHLSARTGPDGVTLTWTLPVRYGNVVVERTADPGSGLSLPLRRARAEGQSWTDSDATAGVGFTYRVYVEYRDAAGAPVRTPGAQVSVRVVPRPRPVGEVWATTADGRTTISWTMPPAGEVRVYAAGAPLAAPGTDVDLADLARRGRFVGAGRRRTTDDKGQGLLTYTSVTVDGDRAVAGPSVAHLVVPAPRGATATDTGWELVVSFTLPPGVTEGVVAARRDRFPVGPDDPQAQTWNVTNTRLELDRGLHVPAPADGAAWYFAVYSAVRQGSTKVVAPTGVQVKAREAAPVTATYTVRREGLRKRSVVIAVTADGPLPALVVRAKVGAVPEGPRDGVELGRLPGGAVTARLEVSAGQLGLPAGVRVFAAGQLLGRPFRLLDPPAAALLVSP